MTKRLFSLLANSKFSSTWIPENLPEGPVVDLGCGNGIISRMLGSSVKRKIICVDRREGALVATREQMRGLTHTTLLSDVCFLGIRDKTCSLVFASRIFSNVKDKELLLKESMRVLKNKGYLIVIDSEKCLNFFKKRKLSFSHFKSPKKMIAIALKKGI